MKTTIHFALSATIAALSVPPQGMREFRIAYPLPQAKSGTITAGGGSDAALEAAVAQSDPKVATLAQTAIDALAESAALKVVTISTANRKVRVLPGDADVVELNAAAATGGMSLVSVLTRQDATKASSKYLSANQLSDATFENKIDDTIVGGDTLIGASKPKLTVGSLISGLEDLAAEDDAPRDLIIVVDQGSDNVRVFAGAVGQGAAADAAIAAGFEEEAIFTQTITASGSVERPIGE